MKKNNLEDIKVLDAQQMNAIQGGKGKKPKKEDPPIETEEILDLDVPL